MNLPHRLTAFLKILGSSTSKVEMVGRLWGDFLFLLKCFANSNACRRSDGKGKVIFQGSAFTQSF